MKNLFLSISVLILSTNAWASPKHLVCTSGVAFETFQATLDDRGWDKDSGYFSVTDATITDNYATAQLICTGNQLSEINCIGYWFGTGSEIGQVLVSDVNGKLSASHKQLVGDLVRPAGPWPCKVTVLTP